nr:hypothetical protein CFP56_71880 [Quercus suber]
MTLAPSKSTHSSPKGQPATSSTSPAAKQSKVSSTVVSPAPPAPAETHPCSLTDDIRPTVVVVVVSLFRSSGFGVSVLVRVAIRQARRPERWKGCCVFSPTGADLILTAGEALDSERRAEHSEDRLRHTTITTLATRERARLCAEPVGSMWCAAHCVVRQESKDTFSRVCGELLLRIWRMLGLLEPSQLSVETRRAFSQPAADRQRAFRRAECLVESPRGGRLRQWQGVGLVAD